MSEEDRNGSLGNLEFVSHVRTLPEDLTKELDEVIGNAMAKGLLTRIVARLESSMVMQGSALETVAELSHKRFLSNERDLRAVSGAVQNVQTSVGQPVELDTRFDAPTLWSSTSFVADEVVRVTNSLTALEDDIVPMRASLKSVYEECNRLIKTGHPDKMLKVLVMVSNKVKEASGEIVLLKSKVMELESELLLSRKSGGGLRLGKARRSPKAMDEMDELMDMFGTSDVSEDRGDSSVTPEKAGEGGVARSGEDEAIMKKLTLELKLLVTADVSMLKAGAEDKSVKFAGLGWQSILDCQEWIKDNFPSHRYGLPYHGSLADARSSRRVR